GSLRAEHVGQRVRLGGWVHRRRDLGGIVFLDLRDRSGLVQVAIGPAWAPREIIETAQGVGSETVILVDGEVVARPADAKNRDMATGDVEVHATALRIASRAATPAIPVARGPKDE